MKRPESWPARLVGRDDTSCRDLSVVITRVTHIWTSGCYYLNFCFWWQCVTVTDALHNDKEDTNYLNHPHPDTSCPCGQVATSPSYGALDPGAIPREDTSFVRGCRVAFVRPRGTTVPKVEEASGTYSFVFVYYSRLFPIGHQLFWLIPPELETHLTLSFMMTRLSSDTRVLRSVLTDQRSLTFTNDVSQLWQSAATLGLVERLHPLADVFWIMVQIPSPGLCDHMTLRCRKLAERGWLVSTNQLIINTPLYIYFVYPNQLIINTPLYIFKGVCQKW